MYHEFFVKQMGPMFHPQAFTVGRRLRWMAELPSLKVAGITKSVGQRTSAALAKSPDQVQAGGTALFSKDRGRKPNKSQWDGNHEELPMIGVWMINLVEESTFGAKEAIPQIPDRRAFALEGLQKRCESCGGAIREAKDAILLKEKWLHRSCWEDSQAVWRLVAGWLVL